MWTTRQRTNINEDKNKSEVSLHNASIENVPNCRYLAVVLNHKLNWSEVLWRIQGQGSAVIYDIETTTEVTGFKIKITAL